MKGGLLRWVGIGAVGVTIVFSVVLASRFGGNPALVESPLLGSPAPNFELLTLDGSETVSMDDLAGNIVVINFFASWCLECRKEHDDLVATAEAFQDQNVTLVQISYQEDPETSLAFLRDAGIAPAAWYLQDDRSRTAISYGVFGIPETFFVDAEGTVVGKIIGETNALLLGATIDEIQRGEEPGQRVTGDTRQSPD